MVTIKKKSLVQATSITLHYGFKKQLVYGAVFLLLLLYSLSKLSIPNSLLDEFLLYLIFADIAAIIYGVFSLIFYCTEIVVYDDGRLYLRRYAKVFSQKRQATIHPDENPVLVASGSSRFLVEIRTQYRGQEFVYPLFPAAVKEVGKVFGFILLSSKQVNELSQVLRVSVQNS